VVRPAARPTGPRIGPARLPPYDEAVLEVVLTVPPGTATTYGDVAAVMRDSGWGGGPRTVGSVMARHGGAVAWWRVVRADGGLPVSGPQEALARHLAEGTPLTGPPDARRVDLRRARAVLAPVPPPEPPGPPGPPGPGA
jgi:alkylated DNA nucleotide flippase Atl1